MPTLPLRLFTRSVIYFQWAAIDIKFGDRWDAAWSFRRSFLAGKENLGILPDFEPSLMLQGAMQVAAGTIPPGYQWLGNLLGIQGTIDDGMHNLEEMLNSTDPFAKLFHEEAVFYFLYLKFHIQHQQEEVFQYIAQHRLDTKNNHLFTFLAANLSLNNQMAASAEQIIQNRNPGTDYLDMPVWDIATGLCKSRSARWGSGRIPGTFYQPVQREILCEGSFAEAQLGLLFTGSNR